MSRSRYTQTYADNTDSDKPEENNLIAKARLNVNDLIQRRLAEKKIDKKRNILIAFGVIAAALILLLIINLIII